MSNLIKAKQIEEDQKIKADNPALVWYWLNRRPFFYASPKIRPSKEKKPPRGWIFIGSFSEDSPLLELLYS
jgi:hypothetical protein